MRLALFTPLSPVRSALVDQIEGLLPHLAQEFQITAVTDGSYTPSHRLFRPGGDTTIPYETYQQFQAHSDDYDLVIYQLGDEGTIHGYMFDALYRFPGMVFLHDLVLHHAIIGLTLAKQKPQEYIREMRYSYGDLGERLATQFMAGHGEMIPFEYPLSERVIDHSLAVVGYNGYMCSQVHQMRPDVPVRHIPYQFYLPDGFPEQFDGGALRQKLGLEGRRVVASFGFFIPDKRLAVTLETFQRLLRLQPDAVYLLVGGHSPYYDLPGQLKSMGLADSVRLTGWQSALPFVEYMHVPDVAVHLRWPHIGGTLYTPIRLLGLGVPTITSDIEPLRELPADGVVRITPNRYDEQDNLLAAMDYLLTHPDASRRMALKGQRYIQSAHALEAIVPQYVSYIREVAERRDELLRRIELHSSAQRVLCSTKRRLSCLAGRAMADVGLTTEDADLARPIADAVNGMV